MLRLLPLTLLALLLATVAAAQGSPGVHVAPERVQPDQPMSFLLVFPDDAQGEARLEVGDGRAERVNTVVGEVELPLDAPAKPGTYVARLTYDTPAGTQHHTATYVVEGDEESPFSGWIVIAILLLAAALRK